MTTGSLYTLGLVAPIISMLLTTPLVTRALGPEGYGTVGVAITLNQVGAILLGFGLPYAITRHAIIRKSGVRGASFLVAFGTLLALLTGAALAVLVPLWGPLVLTNGDSDVLIWPVISAVGLAMLSLTQAFLRAVDRVWLFVGLGTLSSLLAPALGFGMLLALGPLPSNYLSGLGMGHLIAGIVSILATVMIAVPKISMRELWQSIRIGAPTIVHTIATTFLISALVVLASQMAGAEVAGRLQLGLLLGTAPIILLGAFNNSWAPIVYRSSDATRSNVLQDTLRIVSLLVFVLVGGYCTLAPVVVPFIAGPSLFTPEMLGASLVATIAAPFMALYLANMHLVFLAGNTAWLTLTTPLSLVFSVGVVVAGIQLGDTTNLVIFACGVPAFYFAQWLISILLRRRTGFESPRIRSALPALCAAMALPAVVILLRIDAVVTGVLFVTLAAAFAFSTKVNGLFWNRAKGMGRR
ncbi:O-antigen/teichoic acid export membrane protein [Microterricola gilva]|uniref:O-antigen/teichoic acid export membrane protein n=1 Tax=Microterricola gilva TaxID=393267 RepID=A0A4Q8AQV9_9MICO|nr:oligosaccharide flippase family protein [Microterricola gilva]RZU66513.1 O-antigen/teichoic acid export membrane protein [Microterricola gilva]